MEAQIFFMVQMYHVFKVFGKIAALSDINVSIDKGEFVFISGPSGAGKTTFLRLLYQDEVPTSGQIIVNGRNLLRLTKSRLPYFRRNLGIVFQDYKLLLNRTVFENVSFALQVVGISGRENYRRTQEVLSQVGLSDRADAYPLQLSGGEQQRVAIARAIVNRPSLVLADEPTGNLDTETAWQIMHLLEEIHSSGATMLVATHNQEIIREFPHRAIVLNRGRTVQEEIKLE